MAHNSYGHFDDAHREYVITNPKTPFPWINYLGNEDFFGLISNTAGGYNFYKDAKFRRITRYRYNSVPMDSVGRYFYIVEPSAVSGQPSVIWNPGWKPCKTPLDSYECRHGLNYTRITGVKNNVRASVLHFVPLGVKAEIQRLTLTNESNETKRLKLFSYTEWCLWNGATDGENFQRNLSTGEVEVERGNLSPGSSTDGHWQSDRAELFTRSREGDKFPFTAIYHKTEYKERRNHYAYYSVNCAADGYDTDRESFVGLYNDLSEPQAVTDGKATDSLAHGWSPIASHYIEVELKAGESRDFIFVLGYEENEENEKFDNPSLPPLKGGELITSLGELDHHIINKERAHEVIKRFSTVEAVDAAFAELCALWDELLSKYSVASADERLNRMVNIWNQYQCMITFCMSRSASFFESGIGRGMGFRDSNQDLVGFVHQIPSRARQRIIDIASTQFPDGGCYHQYQPLTKRGNNDIGGGFNDDPMWLIFGTTAYIRETGDFSILDEMVPWDNEPGTEVSLMEHLRISFDHVVNNLGPHGLPLIGRADWNDCLNLNCFSNDPNESFQTTGNKTEGSKAESLMIAGLFVYCGRQYIDLLKSQRDKGQKTQEEIARAEKHVEAMCRAVEKDGWDGAWYLRAYDYYGNKVGSNENEEGKIFIESQGWCGMARIGAEKGMPEKALDSAAQLLDSEHGMVLNWPAYTTYHIELGEQSTYPAGYKENGGIFCHNNPWVIIAQTEAGRGNDAWTLYKKIAPAWIEDQDLHKVEPYVYCQMVAGKQAAKPGEGKNSWLTGTAAWNWLTVSQHILGIRPTYDGLMVNPCIPSDLKEYTVTRKWRDAEYVITVKNPNGKQRPDQPTVLPYEPGRHEVTIEL